MINPPCGSGTACDVRQHTATCTCLSGLFGNPYVGCLAEDKPQCQSDFDCRQDLACVDGICKDLCSHLKPCGIGATCRVIDAGQQRTVLCECPIGYTGSAYEECKIIDDDKPDCKYDADCPIFEACIDEKCRDPCADNPCGVNAECRAITHHAICSCPSGYKGDGLDTCSPLECQKDSDCSDNSVCLNSRCVEACLLSRPCGSSAQCIASDHSTECKCLSGYTGDPYVFCTAVGCTSDNSCPSSHACLNGKCVDSCKINNPCDRTQTCEIVNHRPLCSCPKGHSLQSGVCLPVVAAPKPECSLDVNCGDSEGCIEGRCEDLCEKNPCGHQATCTVKDGHHHKIVKCECGPGMIGNPMKECIHIPSAQSGCISERDCPPYETCIDGHCADPCKRSPCASGALCRTVSHRAICSCPSGFHGDPYRLCTPGENVM